MFLMLNPSMADEVRSDPTIRRCISFAASWDCGWLNITNLSPLRATDPTNVLRAGPEPNDMWDTNVRNILEMAMSCDFVVAALENHGAVEGRANRVLEQLGSIGKEGLCLGSPDRGTHDIRFTFRATRPVSYSTLQASTHRR